MLSRVLSNVARRTPRTVRSKRRYTTGSCFEGELESPVLSGSYFRLAADRGYNDFGWLQTHHTFSFSPYYKEPNHRGYRKLRVINEDFIAPGMGFETHPHINMEILTYVMKGSVAHKDSLGNGSTIRPNEIQIMSAGRGLTHSEFNPDSNEPTHLLQIWIIPNKLSLQPSYQQIKYDPAEKIGRLKLIGSPDGRDGSVLINQDASVYASILNSPSQIQPTRAIWVHAARGKIRINDVVLSTGDGVGINKPGKYNFSLCKEANDEHHDSEFVLFDLA